MATGRSVRVLLTVAALLGAARLDAQQPPLPVADSIRLDSVPAVLVGHVVDSAGAGLAGAEIGLLGSDKLHAITSDSGEFRITGLHPGAQTFSVRRIGYQAATFTAMLKPGRTHRANFTLSVSAQALPLVSISDTVLKSHWLDQFERRRSTSRGTFFSRPEIVKKGARSGTDILRTVPGVRLQALRGGLGSQVIMTRGAGARPCLPAMFVHNVPYSGSLDDFTADDIEAIEIYVGVSEIPAELDKNGRGICGAIVVWTRDPRRPP
jgi:hypothetical protein